MILGINPAVIYAILFIIALIAVFFITYVLNKKTPVPKGCEDILISDENCLSCGNTDCNVKKGIDINKIKEELKEEE
ncbi:MAG: hypothetical protein IJA65_01885 [Acholeplasmatales bacterium]|nr:hypothetical protein [Acholeplasmatales bacterium]